MLLATHGDVQAAVSAHFDNSTEAPSNSSVNNAWKVNAPGPERSRLLGTAEKKLRCPVCTYPVSNCKCSTAPRRPPDPSPHAPRPDLSVPTQPAWGAAAEQPWGGPSARDQPQQQPSAWGGSSTQAGLLPERVELAAAPDWPADDWQTEEQPEREPISMVRSPRCSVQMIDRTHSSHLVTARCTQLPQADSRLAGLVTGSQQHSRAPEGSVWRPYYHKAYRQVQHTTALPLPPHQTPLYSPTAHQTPLHCPHNTTQLKHQLRRAVWLLVQLSAQVSCCDLPAHVTCQRMYSGT